MLPFELPVLTPSHLLYIGLIASTVGAFLRLVYEYAAKKSLKVPDVVMLLVVFIASFFTSVVLFPQALPDFPLFTGDVPVDATAVASYLSALVVVLSVYTAIAVLIYNVMIHKVKEAIGKWVSPKLHKGKLQGS